MKQVFALILLLFSLLSAAHEVKGRVYGPDQAIPFAIVQAINGQFGAQCDETGRFIIELPAGQHRLAVSSQGYKEVLINVNVPSKELLEIYMELDPLGLEEVVITADRAEEKERNSSIKIGRIDARIINNTQSINLAQGLSFSEGVRVENNCQSCGFTQVRLLGMEGGYTQILFNGRRIFSDLNAMYGLEQIPAEWIDKVEIVRGGSSASYGSNAVAGVINMISSDAVEDDLGLHVSTSWLRGGAAMRSISAHGSTVGSQLRKGSKLFLGYRDRESLDVNSDGLSDLPQLRSWNLGNNSYFKHGRYGQLNLDLFAWSEDRRGGDLRNPSPHFNLLSEWVEHKVIGLSAYESIRHPHRNQTHRFNLDGQFTLRNSFYGTGIEQSDFEDLDQLAQDSILLWLHDQYARVNNYLVGGGYQFTQYHDRIKMSIGVDARSESLQEHQAYLISPKLRTSQHQINLGIYAQWKWQWRPNIMADLGIRYDHLFVDLQQRVEPQGIDLQKSFNVWSPKLGLKWDLTEAHILRASYNYGFRAPLLYDQDLHSSIVDGETQVVILSRELQEEIAHGVVINHEWRVQDLENGLRMNTEFFSSRVSNPFYHKVVDEGDRTYQLKQNSTESLLVMGVNAKLEWIVNLNIRMDFRGTYQIARYSAPVEVYAEGSSSLNTMDQLRSPNIYGSYNFQYDFKSWGVDLSAIFTGPMQLLYQGPHHPVSFRRSPSFFDQNLFVRKSFQWNELDIGLRLGVKNIFDAFQSDLDFGLDRDSDYVYGPLQPRSFVISLKIE
jgi:outer membrane receptor for ferrienterochelin and colicins